MFKFFNKKNEIIEQLKSENAELRSQIPNIQFLKDSYELEKFNLQNELNSEQLKINAELDKLRAENNKALNALNQIYYDKSVLESQKIALQNEINIFNEKIQFETLGLYEPKYDFKNSTEYQRKLNNTRDKQKQYIKDETAWYASMDWEVNGSISKGQKMTKEIGKMLISSFNFQCEMIIEKATAFNLEKSKEKINCLASRISKITDIVSMGINSEYVSLKIDELILVYELAVIKQKEKEELQRAKEQLKEEELVRKEIEKVKEKLLKERKHYENQINKTDDNEVKLHLINQVDIIDEQIKSNDCRLANIKAGFVYIIKNEAMKGMLKIGVTRRLDPAVRINELSNASVPYKFDTVCVIFSQDCFALETALHKEFDAKRVNKNNPRKEFFNVSINEVEKIVLEKYDPTATFFKDVVNEDYVISENVRNSLENIA